METVIYTVKQGDTLYSIAKRFGTTVSMIARYNGIIEPDNIEAGRVLRIPVSEIPAMCRERAMPYREYIVKKGDTLAAIAEKTGVGSQRIAGFNGLNDPDRIAEGQVLRIPFPITDSKEKEYVVQSGDTLTSVAQKTDTTVQQIAQRNEIPDVDMITAGESILVPQQTLSYQVQTGDTLWQIARRYGVSVPYLVNMNRLCQPDSIQAGQVLIIRR